jgi:2-polyprenyl-6-methoxyphenol hydroxylase-like FAD-dependent oxidoreductase
MQYRTQVAIVGGSLVGLSASLFLSSRGVSNIVVEKHRGSSPHPRAVGFTERTLELFRAVGIGDRIPQVEAGMRLRRARVHSLAGEWFEESQWTPGQQGEREAVASPCTNAAIAQDRLEPILREAALERGSELRLGAEMLSFAQDARGVSVQVRDRDGGEEHAIHADYLIAADGADSGIRERLGIRRAGVGHLRTLRSVLFRCPEADAWLERGVRQFEIEQPGLRAFLTTYGDGRWVLMFDDDRERGEAELRDNVRAALGRDMAFEILANGRWELAGRIAERYREGRVFLAGDAAHQLPPTRGGFGANTGIDDAYNLAWKLQWVLRGDSDPRLLDSYDDERRPIGWLRHQQTFARPDYAAMAGDALKHEPIYGNEAMELGQLQRSNAVIGAGPELPPAAHPDAWAGQPGTRAPHVWIERDGETVSTLDLFGDGFVLLAQEPRWIAAARDAAASLGIGLRGVQVGKDVLFPAESFAARFGVSAGGASLIRPDGIVGWRSPALPDDPARRLRESVRQLAALPA